MASKYTVDDSTRWGWQAGVRLSWHAQERWDARTPPWSVSPEEAFERGVWLPGWACGGFADAQDQTPARVRLYAERTVPDRPNWAVCLLVSDDDTIVTVYDVAEIQDAPLRAYLWAVAQQCGLTGPQAPVRGPAREGADE